MLKILILGGAGMAGHMIYSYLTDLGKYSMIRTCHSEKVDQESFLVDIFRTSDLVGIIRENQPDIIINCVGILIKGSINHPDKAIYVNAYFPHLLRNILDEMQSSSRIIHISTDCVFSGSKGFYLDTDMKDALDVYGMTKNLGELSNQIDLTIRTSIIGPELKKDGEGLFDWFAKQKAKGQANGYKKSIWGGVTTLELAKFIDYAIDQNLKGLFQLSNNTRISKFSLLSLINDVFGFNISISEIDGPEIDKSIQATLNPMISYKVPDYKEMVSELKLFMLKKQIYGKYWSS